MCGLARPCQGFPGTLLAAAFGEDVQIHIPGKTMRQLLELSNGFLSGDHRQHLIVVEYLEPLGYSSDLLGRSRGDNHEVATLKLRQVRSTVDHGPGTDFTHAGVLAARGVQLEGAGLRVGDKFNEHLAG